MGADVAIHGMRENGPAEYGEGSTLTAVAEAVAAEHGGRAISVLGDLTKGEDVARVVETTTRTLGPIDILVHNAGGDIAAAGGKPHPNDAVGVREEDVRAVLARNLLSTILTCQAVAERVRSIKIGSLKPAHLTALPQSMRSRVSLRSLLDRSGLSFQDKFSGSTAQVNAGLPKPVIKS
jgi:3-oxoacyl-[acyl-carrier protein] reductase